MINTESGVCIRLGNDLTLYYQNLQQLTIEIYKS
ncbi:MAG: hypothetical protein ACI8YQ_003984 [Polaribacter sp.]|jgi:hypothetical protein